MIQRNRGKAWLLVGNSLTLDRRNKLAQLLVSEGSVKVGELADMFGVSTETIRKDLLYLEHEGIAKKGHGGAVSSGALLERPLSIRFQENDDVKAKIAQAALALIPEKGVVILDAGSTAYSIAKLLTLSHGLTIITNSAPIPPILANTDNTVYALGGELRGTSISLVGMWTINAIREIQADICFLGTDGFFDRNGPTTTAYAEAEVKKAMIQSSRRVAVVCDSRKFQASAMIQFCEWTAVDYLITDKGAEAETETLQRLRKIMDIIIVPG
jgi:DeoR/GlpR family transcriptional regulator of sugar metabolism